MNRSQSNYIILSRHVCCSTDQPQSDLVPFVDLLRPFNVAFSVRTEDIEEEEEKVFVSYWPDFLNCPLGCVIMFACGSI